MMDYRGRKVTVVGLGIEGIDGVHFFVGQGAIVTVSDAKPPEKLRRQLAQIEGLPVKLSLGANDPKVLQDADYLYISQSVPLDLPGIVMARAQGVPILSMLSVYMDLCPGPIVGITGSSGKTTTTALVGKMLEAEGLPHLVGGNIGVGLLTRLSEVRPYTWSVLEVSHTQLQFLSSRGPYVGAVLNITPNHLDRFSWEEYRALKARLVEAQGPGDWAVLGYDDPEARGLATRLKGEVCFFSLGERVDRGVTVINGKAVWMEGRKCLSLFPLSIVRLRGRHNLLNVLAAAATAYICGVCPDSMACAVASFSGVPHRLELVACAGGVCYYNDSIATTPTRTIAALRSFEEPMVLLLGGRDKHLPLEELAEEVLRRCRAVVLFGESGPKLEGALRQAQASKPASRAIPVVRVGRLEEAVEVARCLAQPGDVVLLSPACTSYDAYDNFQERGDHFRSLVLSFARDEVPA